LVCCLWQACARALSLALLRSHIQKLSPSHPPLSFACFRARSPSLAFVRSRRCSLPLSPPLPPARSHTDPTHSNTHKFTRSTSTSYPRLWRIQYRTHKQLIATRCNNAPQGWPTEYRTHCNTQQRAATRCNNAPQALAPIQYRRQT